MDNKIKFIAWLVVFALVVTIVLFTLFENSAYFETADKTTKLSGSVAFFFVLLMVEFHFINKLHPDSLAPIRANLSGNWIYTADTKEKDKNEISTSTGSAEIH